MPTLLSPSSFSSKLYKYEILKSRLNQSTTNHTVGEIGVRDMGRSEAKAMRRNEAKDMRRIEATRTTLYY